MDLFEYMRSTNMEKEAPLAARMRPRTLDEVVGQEHIIGKDKLLYRAIKADKISSIIFYGPPGTGKTTLAKVIANTTSAEFQQINATVAGKKDMEEVNTKASSNNAKEDTLKAEIYNTLSKVEKELVSAIGSVNVFDLNSENFEIIKKIRGLKDTLGVFVAILSL